MTRSITSGLWAVALASGATFMGCAAEQQSVPVETNAPPAQSAASETSESNPDNVEIRQALAKLSPEDQALAKKQENCPVSGEPLGSMGKPVKVTVEGREAFLCCEGCVDEMKENFAKYEGKLPEA